VYGDNGSVDTSFNAFPSKELLSTSSGAALIVQPDGKLLTFGGFKLINGVAINNLTRLNTDGSLDSSFNCTECNKVGIGDVLLQPDGKIVVAGTDRIQPGKSKTIRINSDGSLDNSFSVGFSETGQGVSYWTSLFGRQADGKIFIGE